MPYDRPEENQQIIFSGGNSEIVPIPTAKEKPIPEPKQDTAKTEL